MAFYVFVLNIKNINSQIVVAKNYYYLLLLLLPGTLYDYEDQPIPFVYSHLLFILTSAYLPLLSYVVVNYYYYYYRYYYVLNYY